MQSEWLAPSESIWIFKGGSFVKARIQSVKEDNVVCLFENGMTSSFKKKQVYQRSSLGQSYAQKQDLMKADILNEPEILKILKSRLENRQIYTFVQNSLIVTNPYTPIPELCTEELKDYYVDGIINNSKNIHQLAPHLYGITALMISQLKSTRVNQAIVISGESGAGKTQTNKESLRFIRHYLNKKNQTDKTKDHIEKIIQLSNPILEAFGNAKTIRNNNSSRFGKYLNIQLNQNLQPINAEIFNYLLEKSRIISRAQNQQNFHIFYEFLLNLPQSQKKKYFLVNSVNKPYSFEYFNYLKTQKQFKYEPHPEVTFAKVRASLQTLSQQSYDFVCRIIATVLFLGNLSPIQRQKQDDCIIEPQNIFQNICELLQVSSVQLMEALTSYTIKVGGDVIKKCFGKREVQELINALAKMLYQKLFTWIISKLNQITCKVQDKKNNLNLGFLDIYGFELLQNNSLEQLFINYTNEKLHQIYLQKIFKEEKKLFQEEKLSNYYQQCNFEDNIEVIKLIDSAPLNIIDLLDEWCSVATPDQSSFILKLRYNHKKNQKFPPNNLNLPSTMFVIRHSPKDIQYNAVGFGDKNKDLLRQQIKESMRHSKLKNLSLLFYQSQNETNDPQRHRKRKFLSSKFRQQINDLTTEILDKSKLHFVRCIKSNNIKKALMMQEEVAFNQICYLGVLDTIKIKKKGYCVKLTYEELDRSLKWYVRHYFTSSAFPKEIKNAISTLIPRFTKDQVLYGQNKVFFKDYAYIILLKKYQIYLEELKTKLHFVASLLIKNVYQKKKTRKKYNLKVVQSYIKSFFLYKQNLSKISNIRKIQKQIRSSLIEMRIARKIKNVTIVQTYIKRLFQSEKRIIKSKAIQRIETFYFKYKLKKKQQTIKIIKNIINKSIISLVLKKVTAKRQKIIEQYLLVFAIQMSQKTSISKANFNSRKIIQFKNEIMIKKYIAGFIKYKNITIKINTIVKVQSIIRGFLGGKHRDKIFSQIIIVQRALREFYFNRKVAKEIFRQSFINYQSTFKEQKFLIQQILYGKDQAKDTIQFLYKNYLKKFRKKCSLVYLLIDFESFVSLQLIYPNSSWLLNYFNLMRQSLQRDNPVQSLQLGETCTIATTTNQAYVWGLNEYHDTLENITQIKQKNRLIKVNVQGNHVTFSASVIKGVKIYSTVQRAFNLQNQKLFQCGQSKMKLIKLITVQEKVFEVGCGAQHIIIRSSAKIVYTFGNNQQGQLGQGHFQNQEDPKPVQFGIKMKSIFPIQVCASFSASIVLMSNKKIYWFGSNGTINKINVPTLIDLKRKSLLLGDSNEATPVRIKASWNRNMSLIGITFLAYGEHSSNISLRNKITDLLINKWQEADIELINPPFHQAYCGYLQECHVKLPQQKINIQPQSRKTLREMENKIKPNQKGLQVSFSDHFRDDYFE